MTVNRRRPYYAKRGWSERFAPVIEALKVIGLTVLFIAFLALVFLATWLGAPEGAGFPS